MRVVLKGGTERKMEERLSTSIADKSHCRKIERVRKANKKRVGKRYTERERERERDREEKGKSPQCLDEAARELSPLRERGEGLRTGFDRCSYCVVTC